MTGSTPIALVLAAALAGESTSVVMATPTLELSPEHAGWRPQLTEGVLAGVTRAGLEVGPTPRCDSMECAKQTARSASIAYVVSLHVTERDATQTIVAQALSVDSDEVIAQVEATCELCGFTELGTTIGDELVRLSRALERADQQPSLLSVRTRPSDATVRVDGTVVGRSPVQWTVEYGPHAVDVERPGYRPARLDILAARGTPVSLDVALERDRSRVYRRVGWSLLGVGVASVASGGVLLAIDETDVRSRCSGSDVDPDGNCRLRHDTLAGGVTMSAVGAVALGAGIGLLVHGIRTARREKRR